MNYSQFLFIIPLTAYIILELFHYAISYIISEKILAGSTDIHFLYSKVSSIIIYKCLVWGKLSGIIE